MNQIIRIKASEDFADVLLAKQLNVETSEDGKYFIFPNGIVRDEYDRRRRERRRENERLCEGVPKDSRTADRMQKRVNRATSYNFNCVPRRSTR